MVSKGEIEGKPVVVVVVVAVLLGAAEMTRDFTAALPWILRIASYYRKSSKGLIIEWPTVGLLGNQFAMFEIWRQGSQRANG
jgi:hypothetical protein